MTGPSGTDRLGATRLFAWVVLAVAGAFILLVGGGYLGLASLAMKIALQIGAVGILGGWLLVALWRKTWRPDSPLMVAILVAGTTYGSSALLSQRPRLSLEPALGGLGFAIAFLFLSRAFREEWLRRRIGSLVIATTSFVALGYIVQVAAEWVRWWQLVEAIEIPPLRPSWAGLTLGAPNIVGAFLLLAGPIAVVLLAQRGRDRRPAALLGALVLIAIFLTGARSAYAAAGVVAILIGALTMTRARLASLRSRFDSALLHRPMLLGLPIAITAGSLLLAPAVLHRFAQGGETVRLDLWSSALEIFLNHPLTGSGPGTWSQLKVLSNAPDTPNLIFSNAHDLYVQAAAELGLVGMAGGLILAVAVARRLLQGLRSASSTTRSASLAAVAGLTGFLVQATFDSLVNLPVICLLIAGLVAWVDSALDRPTVARQGGFWDRFVRGPGPAIAGLVSIALSVPLLVRIDVAWSEGELGDAAARMLDWHAAAAHYESALTNDPGFTLYALQLASARARLGETAAARDLLAAAVEDDPVAVNQIGLAALELELGDEAAAMARADLAVSLGTKEANVALNAGLIAEATGNRDSALDYFADAMAWSPPIAGSTFWDLPNRSLTKVEVVDAAVKRSEPLDASLILAYAGRTTEAAALLSGLPASGTKDLYAAVIGWRAGDAKAAIAQLEQLLDANPLDWVVAGWLARIARLSGDDRLADRYTRWALTVQGDSAPSVILEQSAIPPIFDAPTAGLPRSYPSGVYSRRASPYLLMPQLVRIGVQ